ncbi:MAG: helix-turn-helix domain-containing protein [Bacillus sp. (in: firmicutes)]
MGTLYSLVKQSKTDGQAMEEVLQLFEPKMKKAAANTTFHEREDLSQELKLFVINCLYMYDVNNVPGFWEFKDKLNGEKG